MSSLTPILESLKGLRMLVVGDVMLDHYIWGDTSRISPEAPVPVVEVARDSHVPGAAANVALNLASLGLEVALAGVIGDDQAGEKLTSLLQQHRIDIEGLVVSPHAPTIQKTRVIVRGQQLCRLDREDAPGQYQLEGEKLTDQLISHTGDLKGIILSDYAKGVLHDSLIKQLRVTARDRGITLTCDPKPKRLLAMDGMDLITPNRSEALQLAELPTDPHAPYPYREVALRLKERYNPSNLVVTLGAEGMLLQNPAGDLHRLPTFAREVFDVSGAGDTSIAALSAGLSAGYDLESAARLANTAAGVVVGKVGTATVTPEEILDFEQRMPPRKLFPVD